MAPSSSWNGKGNDAPQKGEDREKALTSLPTLQKTQATRTATVPVDGTYWGCTTTTSQHHFSVPCIHKKTAGMTCTVTGEATHSRQHVDGRKIQLSASRLLTQRHWWILGAQNPTQNPEKGKSKLKSFIPVCFIQLSSSYMVQKEVIMSPYRFFLLHNEGIFFSLQENVCFFWMPLPTNRCAYVWFALTACRFKNLIIFTLVIWLSLGAPKCNPLLTEKLW